jgi:hypothetical protein
MVERSSTCQPSRASRDEPTGGAGSARIDHIRAEPTQVVLLERDEPLAFLDGLLAGIRTGAAGRLVLVAGEAGVGKTALLRRVSDAAGVRVLWGAGEPLRTPRPLGPLLDVADATGGDSPSWSAAGHGRTRSRRRCCASCALRRCSCSRTCTGPTRRRWMC